MSGRRSKRKGASGEREAAEQLTALTGRQWSRGLGQARRGGSEVADVECETPCAVHVEVKRGKRIPLWAARDQARADASDGEVPVVLARRDRDAWVVLVDLDDLYRLVDELRGER